MKLRENLLTIEDLYVKAQDNLILKGVSLEINLGEIHALMGPNGSGKSTFANVIMGNPGYSIESGKIFFHGEEITNLPPDERAKRGVFLAFQHPESIEGVKVHQFLRMAMQSRRNKDVSVLEARIELNDWMKKLKMDPDFQKRSLNDGFSGGEKKKHEILQLALLSPALALLDETDSGLDIDALKVVADGFNLVKKENTDLGALIITHYQRLFDLITPDIVHLIIDGHIVEKGGPELVNEIDKNGYDKWLTRV